MAHDPFIPKGSLKMIAGWLGLSVIVVLVAVSMKDYEDAPDIPTNAQNLALVTVDDTADGGIVIRSDKGVAELGPDANGFVRGVLRALARQRSVAKIGPEHAFVLAHTRDGNFVISDPMTGTQIDLRAFGKDNTLAFAALMPALAQPTGE